MSTNQSIQLFEDSHIRTVWNEEQQKWYFAIVDIVAALTGSSNPSVYWRVLKQRLKNEGNETVTNCNTFKLKASDGKMRKVDMADQEQMFRIIQSIPSPKAEPIKQWMASVASDRIYEFKTFTFDFNSRGVEWTDLVPRFQGWYKDAKKKSKNKRPPISGLYKLPTTFDEFKAFIKSWGKYEFWGRCEYEHIAISKNYDHNLPVEKLRGDKVDVWDQIEANIDVFAKVLMQSLKMEVTEQIREFKVSVFNENTGRVEYVDIISEMGKHCDKEVALKKRESFMDFVEHFARTFSSQYPSYVVLSWPYRREKTVDEQEHFDMGLVEIVRNNIDAVMDCLRTVFEDDVRVK